MQKKSPFNLGFNELEYSLCSFWTSSEVFKEGFPSTGAVFLYNGYASFKPTLTFKQRESKFEGGFYLATKSYFAGLTNNTELAKHTINTESDAKRELEERRNNEKKTWNIGIFYGLRLHSNSINQNCVMNITGYFLALNTLDTQYVP